MMHLLLEEHIVNLLQDCLNLFYTQKIQKLKAYMVKYSLGKLGFSISCSVLSDCKVKVKFWLNLSFNKTKLTRNYKNTH